jgi:hypothetical protein
MRRLLTWLLTALLLIGGLPAAQTGSCGAGCAVSAGAPVCCCGDCGETTCACGHRAPREPQRAPSPEPRILLALPASEPLAVIALTPSSPEPRTPRLGLARAGRAHPLQTELRTFLI